MTWRPEKGWVNPYKPTNPYMIIAEASGRALGTAYYDDAFEAGADAMLTSLLNSGIIKVSDLEVSKHGDGQGNPK